MDSRLLASADSEELLAPPGEWDALCLARIAAKKAHEKLFCANHGKFSTRKNGSIRAAPSVEQITRADAVRDSLDEIEKKMFAFLSRHV